MLLNAGNVPIATTINSTGTAIMHLLGPYLLLLSFGTLPGNASPAGLPVLPILPSNPFDFLMPLNASGLTEWPFQDRPKNMENYIDDYLVKVGSQHPDSGQGDPQKITKALVAISEWYPSQKKPDGKYPAKIKYEGTVDEVKYTFTVEEYRGDLDDQSVSHSYHCHLL